VAIGSVAGGPRYLADKSALARLRHPLVSAVLAPLILAGDVATCGIVDLEILYSARSHADFARTRAIRARAFPLIPIVQADFDLVAAVTGQATQWVVPRGSVP
jgi:predicted nucleic acid-binding protein